MKGSVLLVCCLIATPALAQAKLPIVVSPQTREGFVDVDSGVLDSIKDIKAELRNAKHVAVVQDRDHAQLVLEVVSRGETSSGGGGTAAMPIGNQTFFVPIRTIGLATLVRAGSHEKPIVFQNCRTWRNCARLVAKDLDVWVAANRAVMAERETPPTTQAPNALARAADESKPAVKIANASIPQLLEQYTLAIGSVVTFDQQVDSVSATFTYRDGSKYASAQLRWNPATSAFDGDGMIAHACGSATVDVPFNAHFAVVTPTTVRERYSNPKKVDCQSGTVNSYSSGEVVWTARGAR